MLPLNIHSGETIRMYRLLHLEIYNKENNMARKSPVELRRIAMQMFHAGHTPASIADVLGLHPGAVHCLIEDQNHRSTPNHRVAAHSQVCA